MIVMSAWLFSCIAMAENIDPDNDGSQYAYGENVGWFNWEPVLGSGVHVYSDRIEGYIWGENIGWINVSPITYGGVANDGNGNLSGYAWGENVGWINFSPTYGGITIDANGVLQGWAWGENIGWIHLQAGIDLSIQPYTSTFAQLEWFGINGYTYAIYSSPDLSSWTFGTTTVGSDSMKSWIVPYGTYQTYFYKVQQVSPAGYGVKTSW